MLIGQLMPLRYSNQPLPLQQVVLLPRLSQVLRDAKRVVGFSPIEDIDYLKKKTVSIDDYATVMNISIIDFPTLEMKFPQSFTDNLVLKRVSLFQAAPRVS